MREIDFDSDSDDELPVGWEEKSTDDGNVYFAKLFPPNTHLNLNLSEESSSESSGNETPPSPKCVIENLPPAPQKRKLEKEHHVTKSSYTKKIQWTHPRTGKKKVIPIDLPFGWTKTTDAEGKILFTHKESGNQTYTDPRLAFAKEQKDNVLDIRQRFDGSTTANQILNGANLSSKYAMITGCNAGIGYETAKSLARHGCKVLFANRNLDSTKEAIDNIVKETNASEDDLFSVHLDLASLKSVKKCTLAVKTLFSKHLDYLILNAAVFGLPYSETEDNLETTFQVNHLSHMYLALLLEPLLKKGSKVIFVSSESHRFANLKNVFLKQNICMTSDNYGAMMAYNNSKLFNVITAKMLAEEWRTKGILVNSLHPGNMVFTNLSKSWWLYRLAFFLVRPFTKSLQQAASTTIYVATAQELNGVSGYYFNNCYISPPSELANDKDMITEVFTMSLKMIQQRMGYEGIENYVRRFEDCQTTSNQN